MAYIGNPPAEAYTTTVKDSFSGNGSTVAFTLSRPSLTNDVRVVVENVIQDPTVAYSVSGTTLTFTSAPPSGTDNIYVVHLGPAVQTTVPPGEISAATTFASNVTVQGAFTSRGIDDNATSTAMTLDASGNLLVGKTSTGLSNVGFQVLPSGVVGITRSGSNPLDLNRLSSDGTLIEFNKDGTTVGSIASRAGAVSTIILDPSSPGGGISGGGSALYPTDHAGTLSDGVLTLGDASARWNNLYLSGGVYLGGTGSANLLDDYEEGNWTPVTNSGSWTVNSAKYSKVGAMVTCTFDVLATSTISSNDFTGLPFTPDINSAGVVGYQSSESGEVFSILVQSANIWNFRVGSTQKGLANGSLARGAFTYVTAS
jgi:hypothetical protein